MRGFFVAVLLLAVPLFVDAQTPVFEGTTADVVAWNFSGFTPIPPAQQDEIVRVLEDLDAEIVAAVEINPDNVLHDVAASLTERGTCYESLMLDQTAGQNIGVIFKCGVQVTNPRLIPNSDDGNSRLRKAFAVDVQLGEFDFLLITVHLKASRGASNRAIRDRQTSHIAAFIAAETSGDERDVLVVGDYNMIPGEDASNFTSLSGSGFLRFVSSSDLVGQFSHLSNGNGCDDGNLLDGFAVSDGHTAEYIEGSLRIYPMHRARGIGLCEFRSDVWDDPPMCCQRRVRQLVASGGLRLDDARTSSVKDRVNTTVVGKSVLPNSERN